MAILNGAELRSGTALTAETGSITGFTAGNVVITGDLEVQGTQTTVDSTNVNIGDNIISVNATEAASGGLYVNHTGTLSTGSFIFDGADWTLSAENSSNSFASFGTFSSTIGSSLTVGGPTTISGSLAIEGISNVSASLAALESAPTATLDAVTDAGNTTTNDISVGGLSVSGTSTILGKSTFADAVGSPSSLIEIENGNIDAFGSITGGNITQGASGAGVVLSNGNITADGYLSVTGAITGSSFQVGDYASLQSSVTTGLTVDTSITSTDIAIDGFSSVSASLAALESAPASTLDVVTDAGNTTTNSIEVGGLTSQGSLSVSGTSQFDDDVSIGNISSNNYSNLTVAGTIESSTLDVVGAISGSSFQVGDYASLQSSVTTGLTVDTSITSTDIAIDGFSSVSASLAALESAPASTLDVVTDAGNTTTNAITVGGLAVNVGSGDVFSVSSAGAIIAGAITGSALNLGGPDYNITALLDMGTNYFVLDSALRIPGISDVSASLAALESAPAATLDAVTDAGNTTTNGISVGEFTVSNSVLNSGYSFKVDNSIESSPTTNIVGSFQVDATSPVAPSGVDYFNLSWNGNGTDYTLKSNQFEGVGIKLVDQYGLGIKNPIEVTSGTYTTDVFSIKYNGPSGEPNTVFTADSITFNPVAPGPSWAKDATRITNSVTNGATLSIDKVAAYGIDIEQSIGNPSGTGYLNVAGTATVGQLVETSARRFKDNIVEQESQAAKIAALKPVSYDWKDSGKADFGFIAEEVAEVYPEFVEYNEEGETTGVKYGKMVSVLVKAVQELQAEVAELKAKL